MVLSICACVFFRSASFLRASFACRLRQRRDRRSPGTPPSSSAAYLADAVLCRDGIEFLLALQNLNDQLGLYSGVYVLRVMVSSPFHFLAVFYHVHDNFSSCGLKLWDHYRISAQRGHYKSGQPMFHSSISLGANVISLQFWT